LQTHEGDGLGLPHLDLRKAGAVIERPHQGFGFFTDRLQLLELARGDFRDPELEERVELQREVSAVTDVIERVHGGLEEGRGGPRARLGQSLLTGLV
jgi:hypothetical protein